MECPRCHTNNSPGAWFCGQCGLPLQTQAAAAPSRAQAPVPSAAVSVLPGIAGVPAWPISPVIHTEQQSSAATLQPVPSLTESHATLAYPYSPIPDRSVLAALAVHKPPTPIFWLGLFGLGGTLLCCPAGSAVFLLAPQGSGIDDPDSFRSGVLMFSGCSFFIAVLLAGLFLFIGRPRHAS